MHTGKRIATASVSSVIKYLLHKKSMFGMRSSPNIFIKRAFIATDISFSCLKILLVSIFIFHFYYIYVYTYCVYVYHMC